jgi:hypothetical protein
MASFNWEDLYVPNGEEEDQHWINGELAPENNLVPVPLVANTGQAANWPEESQATTNTTTVDGKRQKA